jgi:hypothetical protein
MLIHDFQRGRLPHFVAPPELKEGEKTTETSKVEGIEDVEQDLEAVGEEKMKAGEESDEEGSEYKDQGDAEDEQSASGDDDEEDEVPIAAITNGEWDDDD